MSTSTEEHFATEKNFLEKNQFHELFLTLQKISDYEREKFDRVVKIAF